MKKIENNVRFERMKQVYQEDPNVTNTAMAERLDLDTKTVARWKKKIIAGLPRGLEGIGGRKPDKKKDEDVIAMLKAGAKNKEIQDKLGVSASVVLRCKKVCGIAIKAKKMIGNRAQAIAVNTRLDSIKRVVLDEERKERAIDCKAEALGLSREDFINGWMIQPTGQQWARDMGFASG